jgi:hypothetical protein
MVSARGGRPALVVAGHASKRLEKGDLPGPPFDGTLSIR